MKLQELFRIQNDMEDKIRVLSGVNEDSLGEENIIHIRFLALQVKIGELTNLTKCYKYNSKIDEISKDKLLFRYLEGMKYLLSIGNKYEFNIINNSSFENVKITDDLVVVLSDIFNHIVYLKKYITKETYVQALNEYIIVFAKYIYLSELLGIEYEDAYKYFDELCI